MSHKLGCHVTFSGQKCLSVSTGEQPDGTHEFYIHALGGAGRHLHGYASVNTQGVILRGGARLKEDVGQHLGDGVLLSHTTQEIARVVITPTSAGPQCTFKKIMGDEWVETSPSTMGGKITGTEVALPCSSHASGGEYSISMFDARSGLLSNTSDQVVAPFSGALPFGVVFTKIACY